MMELGLPGCTHANLFARLWLKVRVHGYASKDIEPHLLLPQRDVDILCIIFVGWDQASFSQVEAGLFVHLADCAVNVFFILVDLSPREAPL